MSAPGLILKEIHRLKKQLHDLQQKIDLAPRQIKHQENVAAKHDETFKQAQDRLKHLKVEIHDKETTIKGLLGVIKKHEKQLDEAASKKEYDALKLEILHEKENIRKLEDEVLDTMGQAEELQAKLPELENAGKKAKEDQAKFRAELDERLVRFSEEKAKAQAELAQLEEQLPEDIKPQYRRVINSRGADALASADNRCCSACYTEITAQHYSDLARHLFVMCKSCGRVLYFSQ